jgi:hypothetical protein
MRNHAVSVRDYALAGVDEVVPLLHNHLHHQEPTPDATNTSTAVPQNTEKLPNPVVSSNAQLFSGLPVLTPIGSMRFDVDFTDSGCLT